ncbi:Carrier domain-containing protein OS=Streptomyces antimycoticus OX=68175 GN=SSPO_011710 PE=4 SV=1 [Streptomyces antimycoticus]
MGIFGGSFGPVAITDRRVVARVPESWTFEQAASTPIVFLTAYYAMVDLAGLEAVGRCRCSRRPVVSAGHSSSGAAPRARCWMPRAQGKWDTCGQLRLARGAHRVVADVGLREALPRRDRRTRAWTWCSTRLAREFVDAGLRLLPRGGRFLEMGKTDIRVPDEVAAEYTGVADQAFDLMEAGADRIHEMWSVLISLFESGVLRPLPVRTWDVRRAPDAFRFISQARHTGKVALTIPRTPGRPWHGADHGWYGWSGARCWPCPHLGGGARLVCGLWC